MGQAFGPTPILAVNTNSAIINLLCDIWARIIVFTPSVHFCLACCCHSSRCGTLHWRAVQRRLVLRCGSMVGCHSPSLHHWLLQWPRIEQLSLSRGVDARLAVEVLLPHLCCEAPLNVLPALRCLSLRHSSQASVEVVGALWAAFKHRDIELDFRCTDAVSDVVDAASTIEGECDLAGCPGAHAILAVDRISMIGVAHRNRFGLPEVSLDELLSLRPACRKKLADALRRLGLPSTIGGVLKGYTAEALLLSFIVKHGRTVTTVPYVMAVADASQLLRQAASVGADLTHQLSNGAHPLFGAAMHNRMDALDVVLELTGTDVGLLGIVDLPNHRGTTPLMVAAMHGRSLAALRLWRAGADVASKNIEGFTAAQLAQERGYEDLACCLRSQGR